MVLSQLQDGKETGIAYREQAMNAHEGNYTITEKKALAVLQSKCLQIWCAGCLEDETPSLFWRQIHWE